MDPDVQIAVKPVCLWCPEGREPASEMLNVTASRYIDPNVAANALEKLTHIRQPKSASSTT